MNTNACRQLSTHATANGSINKGCHRITIDATGFFFIQVMQHNITIHETYMNP